MNTPKTKEEIVEELYINYLEDLINEADMAVRLQVKDQEAYYEKLRTGSRALLEAILQALTLHEQAVQERVVEEMMPWLEHDNQCISTQHERGEPTADGGYRTMYAGVWYDRGKEPKCDCGLDNAITKIKEGAATPDSKEE
jgi:hypothetical protein